jgi:hypothetical protein
MITFSFKTYFMEQSPSWEANRFSDSQEIPRVLWNPKLHYRVYSCLLFLLEAESNPGPESNPRPSGCLNQMRQHLPHIYKW